VTAVQVTLLDRSVIVSCSYTILKEDFSMKMKYRHHGVYVYEDSCDLL